MKAAHSLRVRLRVASAQPRATRASGADCQRSLRQVRTIVQPLTTPTDTSFRPSPVNPTDEAVAELSGVPSGRRAATSQNWRVPFVSADASVRPSAEKARLVN